jgi:oligopeptide transport system substrate-binding protein
VPAIGRNVNSSDDKAMQTSPVPQCDARVAKVDSMVKPEQAEARIAEWRSIFGDIMKDAPWAPIYNEKHITYHSARIGADRNVFIDPFDTPLNYRYIYAKDAQ